MFGRHDAAELATPEHYAQIEVAIDRMEKEWHFWNGDIPDYTYAISPKLAAFTREYLAVLKTVSHVPHFLIWNHSDAFCIHWKRPTIELVAQVFVDNEGIEPSSVSYLEFDMDKTRDGKMLLDEVLPEDYGKIVERLNNPKYTYGS